MRWPFNLKRKATRKRKRGRGRRGALPNPRRLLRGAAALAVVLAVGLSAWLWQSGWVGRKVDEAVTGAEQLSARMGLSVREVTVVGRNRTGRDALIDALGVRPGDPILAFDPDAAQERVLSLPWVRRGTVERRLPDLIQLRLEERRPLALWQSDGAFSLIDRDGHIIADADIVTFGELPVVVGEDAPEHAASLIDVLSHEPELKRRVRAAVRVSGRRWNLRLEGGIDVRMPAGDIARAWAELARIEREHSLLERGVSLIDLRMPDRLVIRAAPGVSPPFMEREEGEST